MRIRGTWIGAIAATTVIGAAGCGQTTSSTSNGATSGEQLNETAARSHGGHVRDHVSLVDALRADGLIVEPTGRANERSLPATGTRLNLSGNGLDDKALIDSYSYTPAAGVDSADAAREDALRITTGVTGSGQRTINAPRVFQSDAVLVLYRGSDPAVVSLLTSLLGPEVTGS